MRIRIFTLLLILGCGSGVAKATGGGDSSRVTNYTPVSTVTGKKWLNSPSSWIRSSSTTQNTQDSETKPTYKRWTGLKYSGYIRSYNQYRWMPEHYANSPLADQVFTVNGLDIMNKTYTGYQEPLMLLRIEGSPTAKTWFQMEYMFDNQLMGIIREDSTINQMPGIGQTLNKRAMAYRIMQFKGYANTKVGDFTLIAGGGVNWYKLSPFTLANYQYRDDLFERYPWQPEGNSFSMYNTFYNERNIARDQRWGNTGTQGFIINGKNLPLGFGFSLIMGKTDNSGGFQTYLTKTPKNLFAFRVDKAFGVHKIGVNFFDQFGTYNNLGFIAVKNPATGAFARWEGGRVRQQILTVDGKFNFNGYKIYTEFGIGRFQDGLFTDRDYELLFGKKQVGDSISGGGLNYNWNKPLDAHCFNFQIDFSKQSIGFPLSFQFFSVRKSVVNVNSEALNSANNHTVATPTNVNTQNDITVFPGAITDIGQMVNNRWGTYLKHEDAYGKLKVSVAWGFNKEWENVSDLFSNRGNSISYWHQSNAFTRSRFTYFQKYAGPYQRISSIYRRTYESYGITDTVVNYLKMYQTLNVGLSYKLKVFDHDLIVTNFNTYNSVTDQNFNPIPVFTDKAFLRTFYEEFMAFYNIHPKVTLVGFASFERVLGNSRVEVADDNGNLIQDSNHNPVYSATGHTVDNTGYGYGVGLDYDFSGRAGLYIRNRWFYNNDKSFKKDYFRGNESTIELKIFF